jgi:hypothetical protein
MFMTMRVRCGGACAAAVIAFWPVTAFGQGVRINEIRVDQPGADLDEFFELTGPAGAALEGLTYIVIGDGVSGNNGVLEEVTDLGGQALDANGLFVAAEATFGPGTANLTTELNFENGDNVTHLLVLGFTGSGGADLDTDDDGNLDIAPWSVAVDGVALTGPPGSGDHVYCPTRVGPDGSGPPFQVFRCSPSLVWRIGAQEPAAGDDTPGQANPPCPCLADLDASGIVDAADLAELLDAWGPCAGCAPDFDCDTDVGLSDLAFLLESWGPCPSAPAPGTEDLFTQAIAVDATDQGAADSGLVVTHVYATGDGVGVGDTLLAVGSAGISAVSAAFFQELIFGGSLPPDSFFFQFVPALRYDTFVAFNLLADDDNTTAAPGLFMDGASVSGAWFAVPDGNQAEAVDISAATGTPGQAGVLIAQITLVPCAAPPGLGPARPGYGGTVRLYTSAADGGTLVGIETDVRFPACPADVDADGAVGITDFLALLAGWGTCSCCRGDIDGDGEVGVPDFLHLVAGWGP